MRGLLKMNRNKETYKYQVLSSWEMNTGDKDEIEEYDTEEKALEVAKARARRSNDETAYVAKVIYSISAITEDIQVEVKAI